MDLVEALANVLLVTEIVTGVILILRRRELGGWTLNRAIARGRRWPRSQDAAALSYLVVGLAMVISSPMLLSAEIRFYLSLKALRAN